MGNEIKVYQVCPTYSEKSFFAVYREEEKFFIRKFTIDKNEKISKLLIN
jgi:hypothetical protein